MRVVELAHGGDLDRRSPRAAGQLLLDHEDGLGARARHDAIEQMQRLCDRPCVQILLERQRLLEERVRVQQRVLAQRDGDLPELLACRPVELAVAALHEREDAVGPSEPRRGQVVAHRGREALEHRVVGRDGEDVAGQAENRARPAHPGSRPRRGPPQRPRRAAEDPCSAQRSRRPKCSPSVTTLPGG